MAAKLVCLVAFSVSSASASSDVTWPRQLGGVDVVEEVCNRIGRGFCQTSLHMPTGATMSYKDACTNNVCVHEQVLLLGFPEVRCGETCVDIPCTGASKQHCGETCVKALTAASEMFACLVKNGFDVQTNKPAVVQQLTAGDDYVIQAAPVDLELYTSMSVAIGACVGGGACHLIHGVLLDYFKSAAKDLGAGFKAFVETFVLTGLLQPLVTASEVKDLFASLENLKAEAAGVKKRAEELDGLKMELKDLGTADNCGLNDLLDNLKEIPSLKDWVAAPTRLMEALDINANSVQAGVVSYNQWADFNVELPCSKMERWESSLLGHTVSADIPKFFACDFSYKLPLPNEHIPYLRIKDAAKALAAV
ncbi:unnamed protein product, partial [Symbiodinium necroappetens]